DETAPVPLERPILPCQSFSGPRSGPARVGGPYRQRPSRRVQFVPGFRNRPERTSCRLPNSAPRARGRPHPWFLARVPGAANIVGTGETTRPAESPGRRRNISTFRSWRHLNSLVHNGYNRNQLPRLRNASFAVFAHRLGAATEKVTSARRSPDRYYCG